MRNRHSPRSLISTFALIALATLPRLAVAESNLDAVERVDTPMVGNKAGDAFYDDVKQPSYLTGVVATMGRFGTGHVLLSVQGIYETPDAKYKPPVHGDNQRSKEEVRVEAKPGYAVAGATVRSGERVDGFRLIFMRKKDGKLDPNDKYESRWIGGRGGGEAKLAADGRPIISIIGRTGPELTAFGFVQLVGPKK
jgi:hypothetical protein